jgi:hypothetical protein
MLTFGVLGENNPFWQTYVFPEIKVSKSCRFLEQLAKGIFMKNTQLNVSKV